MIASGEDEPRRWPSFGPWPDRYRADYPASWWIPKRIVDGEEGRVSGGGGTGDWRSEAGGGERERKKRKRGGAGAAFIVRFWRGESSFDITQRVRVKVNLRHGRSPMIMLITEYPRVI